MTTYLCTTGTSAAKKLPAETRRLDARMVETMGGEEAAAEQVYSTFSHYEMSSDERLTKDLSAEIQLFYWLC